MQKRNLLLRRYPAEIAVCHCRTICSRHLYAQEDPMAIKSYHSFHTSHTSKLKLRDYLSM